jgi:hypothetical protein
MAVQNDVMCIRTTRLSEGVNFTLNDIHEEEKQSLERLLTNGAFKIYLLLINSHVRRAWLDQCAVRAMRENLKVSSDSKKCSRSYGGAYGGVWRSLRVMRSVLCCCVWQESGCCCSEEVFTFYLLCKEILKVCIFNVICKDNAATNCKTVQHTQKKFISVNFDGSYASILHITHMLLHWR